MSFVNKNNFPDLGLFLKKSVEMQNRKVIKQI